MTTAFSEHPGKGIPGPEPVPVLGQLPWLFQFARDPLRSLEKLRQRYGDMVGLGLDKHSTSAIVIFHPELNRQILRDPSVFYSYDMELLPIPVPKDSSLIRVTTGMPLMNGPRHSDHRSALLPYFHKKFITRYHEAASSNGQ
jgi:cytochrome P450